jgi:hypothetical protein
VRAETRTVSSDISSNTTAHAPPGSYDDHGQPVPSVPSALDQPDRSNTLLTDSFFASLAPQPRTLADLDLPEQVLIDLILRRVLLDGRSSMSRMAQTLSLPLSLVETFVRWLREDKKYLDFESMVGLDWVIGLTELGRQIASESAKRMSYAGTAPVSLAHYCRIVAAQRRRPVVTRDTVRNAFHDLVVSDAMLDEIGPAVMGDGAIFLYGPPGTGKSSVAERVVRLIGDAVLIPRSVEVDGAFVMVFDPTVHAALEHQPEGLDRRWVVCRRPSIVVGGELVRSQLDLFYDEQSGLHLAPLQMKANNGILVIDDFGRQQMSPTELLNRWIVPLDRSIDFLTLAWGVRFDVPFDARVVFSTNLDPSTLGDEAFFRRLPNKVFVGSIDDDQFDWILAIAARRHGVHVERAGATYLREHVRANGDGDLRPYVPNVACQLAKAICNYEGITPRLDSAVIDRVASMYFTKLTMSGPGSGTSRIDGIAAESVRPHLAS